MNQRSNPQVWRRSVAAACVLALAAAGLTPSPAMAGDTPESAAFADVAAESGLDFTCDHWARDLGVAPRWFIDVFFCASPVVADFNGDGYQDLFFPNTRFTHQELNDARNPQDALFLNNGDGTFTDATRAAGFDDTGYSMGAAALDFDNDGDLDIYIANFRETPTGFRGINSPATVFYVNNGDGTFTKEMPAGLETQTRAGVADNQWGMAVAVADYDLDGDVDLFRGNYAQYQMTSGMPPGLQVTIPDSNNLFQNQGDGTFVAATDFAGIGNIDGRTFGANFADFNGDLRPDLYVANDENRNEVYLNNGDATFADYSVQSRANDPRGSMCSETADFNNDGKLDLYMAHYENEDNGYYLGNGDGTFEDNSRLGELDRLFEYLGWGCPAIDYDNDGDRDLFVANGHMLPIGGQFPGGDDGYELPNFLFQNTLRETGVHSWRDVSASAGPALADRFVSSGVAAVDLDLDGRQELIVVNNNGAPTSLYRNQAPQSGHWLSVDLRGSTSNSFGIGAQVTVTTGDLVQIAQRITGNTLASGSVSPLHFGLGTYAGDATVLVEWPSGATQTEVVPVNRPVLIIEGTGARMDTLAPKVDIQLEGTRGQAGWWTSSEVQVALSMADRAFGTPSGAGAMQYTVDGGAPQEYTGPFMITGEGFHEIVVIASDLAGNRAWYPTDLRIDSQAPSGHITDPIRGHLQVQGRSMGPSVDGSTIIVAPMPTPNSDAEQTDQATDGAVQYVEDQYGFPIPGGNPVSAYGTLMGTVGSDRAIFVQHDCEDGTSGIDRVVFEIDGQVSFVDTAAPFVWDVDLRGMTLGEHEMTATVYDRAGLSSTDVLPFTLIPSTQDGVANTAMGGI